MTQQEFESRQFQFEVALTKGSQQIKRMLDKKYREIVGVDFRSKLGREDYRVQLATAKQAESEMMLRHLCEDLEAEFFGSMGMMGIEKSLSSVPKIIGLSAPDTKGADNYCPG